MPAGPGRYESESPAAFWLDGFVHNGAQDDTLTLDGTSEGSALFLGPISRETILDVLGSDVWTETASYGWDDDETSEALDALASSAGSILSWNESGFVYLTIHFTSADTLRKDWQKASDEYREANGPTPEDYVIETTSRGYSVGIVEGKHLGTFVEWDDAEACIRADGNAHQFWPDVWHVSDHGNASILSFRWDDDDARKDDAK